MPLLPPLRLTGATILRDGELRQRSVAVQRGRISKGPLPAVNLEGYLILPGIIDLLASPPQIPGPITGPTPPAQLLKLAQSRAAAAGVTTAWLAPGWAWEGSLDCPSRAQGLLQALNHRSGPVDLRPALRVEVSRSDLGAALIRLIEQTRPQIVYFQNQPEALYEQMHRDPQALRRTAHALGLTPAALTRALRAAAPYRAEIPRHLCRIAEALDAMHASYGSLADPGGDIRENYSMIGARLATCPAAYAAAAAARAMDNPVLLAAGARGGWRARSHAPDRDGDWGEDQGVNEDVLRAGLASALVSAGDWPALARHALDRAGPDFALLPKLWPLLSSAPAEIIGLADRGTLDYGRRADLVIINARSRQIEGTICGGELAHLSGEARDRFQAAWSLAAKSAIAAE